MSLSWTLNPYSKIEIYRDDGTKALTSDLHQSILDVLAGYRCIVKTKRIYLDVYTYSSDVEDLPSDILLLIKGLLRDIAYIKLTYTITAISDIPFNNEINLRYSKIKDVILKMVGLIYGIPVDDIRLMTSDLPDVLTEITEENNSSISFKDPSPVVLETEVHTKIFTYIPTIKGNYAYVNLNAWLKLNQLIKPIDYLDWFVISTDSLTPFVISQIPALASHQFKTLRIPDKQISLYLSSKPVRYFETYLKNFRKEGYISIVPESPAEGNVYPEIGYLWGNLHRIEDIIVIKDGSLGKGLSSKAWYRLSLDEILSGSIPKVRIFLGNFIDVNTTDETIVWLSYMVKQAYIKLTGNYPELRSYQDDVSTVGGDFTFTVRLYDSSQHEAYLNLIEEVNVEDRSRYLIVNESNPILREISDVTNLTIGKIGSYYILSGEGIFNVLTPSAEITTTTLTTIPIDLPETPGPSIPSVPSVPSVSPQKINPEYLIIVKSKYYESYMLNLSIPKSDLLVSDEDGDYLYETPGDYLNEVTLKTDLIVSKYQSGMSKTLYESSDVLKVINVRNKLLDTVLDNWSDYILRRYGKMSKVLFYTLQVVQM